MSHAELLADAAAKVVESHRHPSWDYRLPERFRGGSGTQGDPAAAVIGAHESPASDSAGLLAARRIGFRSSLLSSGGPEPCQIENCDAIGVFIVSRNLRGKTVCRGCMENMTAFGWTLEGRL